MNKKSGFTLIEIVMVLVLLGILAAVAIPKYYDLQEQALDRAADAVQAEMQAQINGAFANGLLTGSTCSAARTAALTSVNSMGKTDGVKLPTLTGKEKGAFEVTFSIRKTDKKRKLVAPACSGDPAP